MFVHLANHKVINANLIEMATYTPKTENSPSALTLQIRFPNGTPQDLEVEDGWADRTFADLANLN